MKKFVGYLMLLILASSAVSCTLFINHNTPKGYVRYAVSVLDRNGLYADRPEWQEVKAAILAEAKTFTTMDQAHEAVSRAAKVAGGKHSALVPPVADTASYPEVAPEVKSLDGNILHVVLPFHTGVKVPDSLYIHTVLDFLHEHLDAKGVIVDLRGNTGGNMGPMISAVSPLLPDGIILRFKGCTRTTPISLESVLRGAGLPADGYMLLITIAGDMARTGEVFCEDPVNPDVNTETPLEDAIAWIESLVPCI